MTIRADDDSLIRRYDTTIWSRAHGFRGMEQPGNTVLLDGGTHFRFCDRLSASPAAILDQWREQFPARNTGFVWPLACFAALQKTAVALHSHALSDSYRHRYESIDSVQCFLEDAWGRGYGDGSRFNGRIRGKDVVLGPVDMCEALIDANVDAGCLSLRIDDQVWSKNGQAALETEILAAILALTEGRDWLPVFVQSHNRESSHFIMGRAVKDGCHWFLINGPHAGFDINSTLTRFRWMRADQLFSGGCSSYSVLVLRKTGPLDRERKGVYLMVCTAVSA